MSDLWHVIGCQSLVGGVCNCAPKDLHEKCRADVERLEKALAHVMEHWDTGVCIEHGAKCWVETETS